jgi:cobalt-zinc-cadmium efflux system protein
MIGAMGHDHHHGHHHHHAPADNSRLFAIAAAVNVAFVAFEGIAGLVTGSLALLADAGHNLSDVLGLLMAWGAAAMARQAPTGRRTYGLRKGTILASVANAGLLLVAVGVIAWEAVHRFGDPHPIATQPVMVVAGVGVLINTATALMFMRARKEDLNARGAFLHMAADAAISLGVVVAALAIALTGQWWIDPVVSLVIVAVILLGTWDLLRESLDLALDAAPKGIDTGEVRGWLEALPGVTEVHDLHVWAMSTTETALTAHLTRPQGGDTDDFLHEACAGLSHRFGIGHATLQIETGGACRLAPPDVV